MSDLAPFVAAAIRDRTVEQLHQELQTERRKVEHLEQELARRNTRMIRVTGPGGYPIYAEKSFNEDEARTWTFFGTRWRVNLNNSPEDGPAVVDLASCPMEDIDCCELHIGSDSNRAIMLKDRDYVQILPSQQGDLQMFCFHEQRRPWVKLIIRFGPDPFMDRMVREKVAYRNTEISQVQFTQVDFENHPFHDE